jgi:hypothetical protein
MKLLILAVVVLTGCANPIKKAIDNTTYSAYEMVGIEKRDLLKRRIVTARDEQKEAGEEFKDALDQLKKVYSFDGGNLEKEYNSLNSSYEDAKDKVADVNKSIEKMNDVATDLFKEWEKEIKEMESETYKAKSRESLQSTKARYQDLHKTLKVSENKMPPVLAKLKDNVLFLKHNLNAQAVTSLKKEAGRIQTDIESLIKDMEKSIASSDKFIEEM